MFSSDEEKETPEGDSSCAATVGTNPTPGTEKDFDFNGLTTDEDGHKVKISFSFCFFSTVVMRVRFGPKQFQVFIVFYILVIFLPSKL